MTQPTTPPRRRLRGLLVNLLLVVLIYIGVNWYQARPLAHGAAPPLVGELVQTSTAAQGLAAVFGGTVETASGPAFDLTQLRGEPVLVYFWASWCPICKLGEGGIDALAREHRVITVALQSGDSADLNTWLADRGLGFPTIADPDGAIADAWGVSGVPASFIVDGDGQISHAGVGYITALELRARLWAAGALP